MNIRIVFKKTAYNFMFGRKHQYALFSIVKEYLDDEGKTEFADNLFKFRDNFDYNWSDE